MKTAAKSIGFFFLLPFLPLMCMAYASVEAVRCFAPVPTTPPQEPEREAPALTLVVGGKACEFQCGAECDGSCDTH